MTPVVPAAGVVAAAAARLAAATGLRVRTGVALAPYTTMRVGGPADLLVEPRTTAALVAALDFARVEGLAVTVIGRGSDLVVADAGIRGLVVLNRTSDLAVDGDRLVAASGVQLARAATTAEKAGLAGLEFGLAIPGSVGGAVWANAGAHGSEIADVLEAVALLRPDGERETARPDELRFSYRDSALKRAPAGLATTPTVVLGATFRLAPAPPEAIRARSDAIRVWRREHQPLTQPSAGSIFRNPAGDSAGRLIDAAGMKGQTEGGASISARHANFIVNTGSATASDVRRLALRAAERVRDRFGVELAFEVEFAGDWSGAQEEAR